MNSGGVLLGAGRLINCIEPTFFVVSRKSCISCHWLRYMRRVTTVNALQDIIRPDLRHAGSGYSGDWCRSIQRAEELRRSVSVNLLAAMASHIHCQLQTIPDSKFVKYAAQVILDHLFAGADDLANFAISQASPDQNRNLIFLWVETFARCHDLTFVFVSIHGRFAPISPRTAP